MNYGINNFGQPTVPGMQVPGMPPPLPLPRTGMGMAMGDLSMNQVADVPGMRALSVPGFDSMGSWGSPDGLPGVAGPAPMLPAALDSQIAAATGVAGKTGNWFRDSGFLGGNDEFGNFQQGWGGMAIGGLQAGANLFMGMKQYGLAKKQLSEGKRQFDLNYGAQKQTINTQLEDRQKARVASNAGAYEATDSYMARNAIK
jgi:hypothetical protein